MPNIVYSPNRSNYRKVAQYHYNLTDEQMLGVDIHHNPPRCEGGRNIPEHLFIYHPITHKSVHDKQAIDWATKSSGNTNGPRGCPPQKTQATQRDIECITLRNEGLTRKEICDRLGLKMHQVKRSIREAMKYHYNNTGKPGPKKGLLQRGGVPKGTDQPNQYTGQNKPSVL